MLSERLKRFTEAVEAYRIAPRSIKLPLPYEGEPVLWAPIVREKPEKAPELEPGTWKTKSGRVIRTAARNIELREEKAIPLCYSQIDEMDWEDEALQNLLSRE